MEKLNTNSLSIKNKIKYNFMFSLKSYNCLTYILK